MSRQPGSERDGGMFSRIASATAASLPGRAWKAGKRWRAPWRVSSGGVTLGLLTRRFSRPARGRRIASSAGTHRATWRAVGRPGWYHRIGGGAAIQVWPLPDRHEHHPRASRPRACSSAWTAATAADLQRQICASIQRAILDGVVAPGTRLPSSRALADDLGVSRTTTLLAVQQLQAEGYLPPGAADPGPSWRRRAPGRPDPPGRRPAPAHPAQASRPVPPRRRAGGAPPGRPPPRRAPARLPHRHARRGSAFRSRSGGGSPAAGCGPITPTQLDYGEPAGLRALREAIADHVQAARGTRCSAEQILIVAGAQQGLELISRVVLDPGDRVWMEEPGYPGRAARSWARARGSSRCRWMPRGWTWSWGRGARARPASPT